MIVDPSFRNRNLRRGKRLPYIGGSTKVKVAKGLLEIIDPDPLDKSIISLGQIANWLILRHGDQVVGGTADHRAQVL